MSAEEDAPPATRREWIGLGILSIACLIYSMDLSVLFAAIPAIVADLNPDAAEILWINDIYGFMVAGFLVTPSPARPSPTASRSAAPSPR